MFTFKKEEFKFPIKYDENCYFYEDYLLMDNEDYPYDKIFLIHYINNSEYTNGVRIKHQIVFSLAFTLNNYIAVPLEDKDVAGTAEFSYDRGLIATNKRLGKVLEFIYNYISSKTLDQRLKLQLLTLQKYGKFALMNNLPVFYNNGDMEINNKIVGNLKKMFDNEKIINGEKYGGYNNKTTNSYLYGFEKGTKFFGIISDKILFSNSYNRDVMFILLNNLYKMGEIINLKPNNND